MPSDGSGNYTLPIGYLAVTGEVIEASQHNPPLEDLRDAVTSRVMRSGAAAMTGPFKAADGSEAAPALVFASAPNWGFYKTGTGVALSISGTRAVEFGPSGIGFGASMPVGGTLPFDGVFAPSGWLFKYGQAVSRATYALLFAALTATATATRSGTTGLTGVTVDFTGLGLEGSVIEGTGITAGTTIASLTSNTITLSQAATGSGDMTIRIFPQSVGYGDGSTTFNIPDDRGYADVGRDNMGGTSANRLTGLTNGLDGDQLGLAGGEQAHVLTNAQMPTEVPHHHAASNTTVFVGSGSGGFQTGVVATAVHTPVDLAGLSTGTATVFGGSSTAHNNVQPSKVRNKIIFAGI